MSNLIVFVLMLTPFFISMELQAQPLNETQKVIASDGAAEDDFGLSVDISGDYAIVGADSDDDGDFSTGSAYIFKRDLMGNWNEVQKLTASDAQFNDLFGTSVSISGDYAIVGAERDSDNGLFSGSAYIFKRDAMGNWNEVQKLIASDGAFRDFFGTSVSISGNYAIVGANEDGDNGEQSGSAYLFEMDANGNWNQVQKLTASDGGGIDQFGISVSISSSSERAIIGAYRNTNSAFQSGAVYVFDRGFMGNWNETQKLTASDGTENAFFGWSVSISDSGDMAIIGAEREGFPNGPGAAYIFKRSVLAASADSHWMEVQKLTASDGAGDDRFGSSVSISEDLVVIGAFVDDDDGSGSGSAYIFERRPIGKWNEIHKLTASDAEAADLFGFSVSISDGIAFV